MANTITLYSISELLGRNFFIPSYQRGYRWEKQQVEDLLNDIFVFASKKHKTEKEFYCLQPLVVKKCNEKTLLRNNLISDLDGNIWYEVIDGQQRLTTIRILISYLVKELYGGKSLFETHNRHLYNLKYETRKESSEFLDNIRVNDEYIDSYFIFEAYQIIEHWFKKQNNPQKTKEKLRNTFIDNREDKGEDGIVQVIWYEIEDNLGNEANAIDTFIRINLGKIPLTSSELIKALLLQEREFYKGKEKENEIAKLKQLQIATEWDSIESGLHIDDFWWFINETENNTPARIDFIFNLIKELKIQTDPSIKDNIGTDSYATFRYFYQKFDNHIDFETLKKEWDTIKHYYLTLEEWYNNPIWYHYIGFLIYCGVSVLEIYKLTKNDFETDEKIETKKDITISLKKRIKDHLKSIKWGIDLDDNVFLNLSYNDDKKFLKQILLLYNIECIVNQCEARTIIYKFPFKTFKEMKNIEGNSMSWDVEHIDSYNSNKLPNRNTRIVWLQFALEEIENNTLNEKLISKINNYIENEKSTQSFEELNKLIIEITKENENNDDLKNNIGNLTLLDAGTNRGYGNALFPTKRRKIIEKDKLGVFIPICTKNVFLKYFDPNR